MADTTNFNWVREEPSYYCGDQLHKIKLEKVKSGMKNHGLDALLLFQSSSVRYVTDFFVKGYRAYTQDLEYLTVVHQKGEPVLGYQSGSDEYRVTTKCLTEDARKLGAYENWPRIIAEIIIDYNLNQAKIGTDMLPFDWYLSLKREFPEIEFVNAEHIWSEITSIKHPIEIDFIKKALKIVEKGIKAAMDSVEDGIPEYELLAPAEYAMRKAGNEVQFGIMQVASGRNSAIYERIATEKIIRNGEMVILDFLSSYRGYTGDLGRTVICGGKPTDIQKEIFAVQVGSLNKAIEAIKPGVKCSEIDRIAKQYIEDAGFGKYKHRFATGHQLGYGLHGGPMIAEGVDDLLKPNMVVCLEPRVHLFDQPNVGGAHNEEAVLVTETGAEKLSTLEYDTNLLP